MGEDTREVRHEVDEAREQLGDTVEALAYKANAPKRAKEQATTKAHAVKEAAATKAQEAKQRMEDAKTRVSTDSRARTARDGDTTTLAGRGSSLLQPVIEMVKRHPNTTAAAAAGTAAGILIGRISAKN